MKMKKYQDKRLKVLSQDMKKKSLEGGKVHKWLHRLSQMKKDMECLAILEQFQTNTIPIILEIMKVMILQMVLELSVETREGKKEGSKQDALQREQ
jgi:hypothetical protein